MVILQQRVPGMSVAVFNRFVSRAKRVVGLQGGVTVLVTTSRELRTLNRRFGGKDKATDVLSFPAKMALPLRFAGDVAISADIASQNAGRLGHSVVEEIKILALHGLLHLAGHDHERDNGEMSRTEMRLRKQLGLPMGLIERSERPARLGGNRGRSSSAGRRPRLMPALTNVDFPAARDRRGAQ